MPVTELQCHIGGMYCILCQGSVDTGSIVTLYCFPDALWILPEYFAQTQAEAINGIVIFLSSRWFCRNFSNRDNIMRTAKGLC